MANRRAFVYHEDDLIVDIQKTDQGYEVAYGHVIGEYEKKRRGIGKQIMKVHTHPNLEEIIRYMLNFLVKNENTVIIEEGKTCLVYEQNIGKRDVELYLRKYLVW